MAKHLTLHGGDRAVAEGMPTTFILETTATSRKVHIQNTGRPASPVCISRLHLPFAPPASHPPTPFAPPRSIARFHSAQSPGVESGRTRMTWRHAGSPSSKDMEIERMLPSYVDLLPVTPRIPSRKNSNLSITSSMSGIEGRGASTRGGILSPPW